MRRFWRRVYISMIDKVMGRRVFVIFFYLMKKAGLMAAFAGMGAGLCHSCLFGLPGLLMLFGVWG